ncbi:flagellar basal body rod protein FlgB [Sphingorhabdus arenilitoris]|uniref:Flagellar basal body rod protein FlgB n=1 Tax=Sphingorhabdus arenilitoris TaxID=1490041 RepID=A0ABV8RCC2_9SPHN
MDSISSIVILKAMDGLSMRAKATAQNIANANSPGYRPVKVSFEESLKAASKRSAQDIQNVQPQMFTVTSDNRDGDLRIDLEMAAATRTAGRYGTLAELLNRRLQLEALSVTGSR